MLSSLIPAGAQGGCTLAGTLTGNIVIKALTCQVTGPVSIPAGASLNLTGSQLAFSNGAHLQVDGHIAIKQSTLAPATGTYDITLGPTASGALDSISASGYSTLLVQTSAVTLSSLNLTHAGTALAVQGVAQTASGLQVASSSIGVQLLGGAVLTLTNPTIGNDVLTPLQFQGNDANPILRILHGAYNSTRTQLAGSSSIQTLGQVHVSLQGSHARGPLVQVQALDRDGNVQAQAAGPTPVLLVPTQVQTLQGTRALTPYRILAINGTIADHQDLADLSLDPAITLTLDTQQSPQGPAPPAALQNVSPNGLYSTTGTVSLAWMNATDGDALRAYLIIADAGTPTTALVAHTLMDTTAHVSGLSDGVHTLLVRAVDLVGNTADSAAVQVTVDRTPPQIQFGVVGNTTGATMFNHTFQVAVQATDATSGVAGLRLKVDDAGFVDESPPSPIQAYSPPPVNVTTPGEHIFTADAVDAAGNHQVLTATFVLDTKAPTLQATLSPDLPTGLWSAAPFNLTIAATDDHTLVPLTLFSIDGGAWQPALPVQPLALSPGLHTIHALAMDEAGNRAQVALVAAYDPLAPALNITLPPLPASGWYTQPVSITIQALGTNVQPHTLRGRLDGGGWTEITGLYQVAHSGNHTLEVRVANAGGLETGQHVAVPIDLDDPVPPVAIWSESGGTLHASWANPAYDATSGVARLTVEEASATGPKTLLTLAADALTAEVPGLSMGTHTVRLRVDDLAGRSAVTPWYNQTLTNAPVISKLSTVPVRGILLLQPSGAFDVREVQYFLDGQLLAASGTPPFAVNWDTSMVEDGQHTIRIVTHDGSGAVIEQTTLYDVRNAYSAVLTSEAIPLAAVVLCATAWGILAVLRIRTRPQTVRRPIQALLPPGIAIVLILAAPLALHDEAILWGAWLAFGATALVFSATNAVALWRTPAAVAPAPKPIPRPIDFDRPWRGGAP